MHLITSFMLDQHSLTDVDLMSIPLGTPRYKMNPPKKIPYKIQLGTLHNAVYLFDLKFTQDEGVVFWHTTSKAMKLHQSVPAVNQPGEILCEKELPLQQKADHRFDGISHAVVDEDPVRSSLISRVTRQVFGSRNKQEFVRDVFPKDGKSVSPIGDQARKVIMNTAASKHLSF